MVPGTYFKLVFMNTFFHSVFILTHSDLELHCNVMPYKPGDTISNLKAEGLTSQMFFYFILLVSSEAEIMFQFEVFQETLRF